MTFDIDFECVLHRVDVALLYGKLWLLLLSIFA